MAHGRRGGQAPSLPKKEQERPDWLARIGWLALIWLASVAALGLVALLLRLVMRGVGLTAG